MLLAKKSLAVLLVVFRYLLTSRGQAGRSSPFVNGKRFINVLGGFANFKRSKSLLG